MSANLLELREIRASYGRAEVLHGVSLSVSAGSIVTVIGANGAGKTTLLNAIMGIVPSTGEVLHDGRAVPRSIEDRVSAGICLVPEKRELFSTMSVEDNIDLGGFLRSASERAEMRADLYGRFPRLDDEIDGLWGDRSSVDVAPLIDLAEDRPGFNAGFRKPTLQRDDRPAYQHDGGIVAGIGRFGAAEMDRQAGQGGRVRIFRVARNGVFVLQVLDTKGRHLGAAPATGRKGDEKQGSIAEVDLGDRRCRPSAIGPERRRSPPSCFCAVSAERRHAQRA